jgi:hypothetical protein
LPTEQAWLIENCPVDIWEAWNTLIQFGVNPRKLFNVIRSRKRASGKPRKDEETARLLFSVEEYKASGAAATDTEAICAVLDELAARNRLPAAQVRADHLGKLKTRLSRYRRRLQKP